MKKTRNSANGNGNGAARQLELLESPALTENQPKLVTILPPQDVLETLKGWSLPVKVIMLDPWYNKGVGGVRDDYDDWLVQVVGLAGKWSEHVFVWGFPEIVWRLLNRIPSGLSLVAWLTWYYKNCPSVIRGWHRPNTPACTSRNPRLVFTRNTS